MMTLAEAMTAYPIGCTLRYGRSHSARVVCHYVDDTDTLTYIGVVDEHGATRRWAVDMLAASGVVVEREQ